MDTFLNMTSNNWCDRQLTNKVERIARWADGILGCLHLALLRFKFFKWVTMTELRLLHCPTMGTSIILRLSNVTLQIQPEPEAEKT